METVTSFTSLDSKVTADGDCSHEIKRLLLLGRKAMTNLDSILKSRDITLLTKVHLIKAMVFPIVMYGCEVKWSEVTQSWLTAIPWTAACYTSLSFTISQSLLRLMSIELVMPSNHLILCRPLLLVPSLSFSISPSNEYSGLISCRIDWLGLIVQGALKSLLQHHSSKASVLWCSAFFMVQLSHPSWLLEKP